MSEREAEMFVSDSITPIVIKDKLLLSIYYYIQSTWYGELTAQRI